MDLYKKVIEFYSASNNDKYEFYLSKLHDLIGSPRVKGILEDINANLQNKAESNTEKDTVPQEEDSQKDSKENTSNVVQEKPIPEKVEVKAKVEERVVEAKKENDLEESNVPKKEVKLPVNTTKTVEKSGAKEVAKPNKSAEKLKAKTNEAFHEDGIVIDNSENLPDFDEGNESPDSD